MQPECELYNDNQVFFSIFKFSQGQNVIQYSKGNRFSILNSCNPRSILLVYKSIIAIGDVFEEAKRHKTSNLNILLRVGDKKESIVCF